jgi:hypothetical protein
MSHALKGIALTFLFTLLLAMLAAAAFRFPVPFAGLIGPFGDLQSLSLGDRLVVSAQAWVFYSALSLGLVQILGGGALGLIAGLLAQSPASRKAGIAAASLLFSLLVVLGLATLDWLIGPW